MGIKVGVYGAGVIGLTTALQLQRTFPDFKVTILASEFGKDTTSDGAAGLYRPGRCFSVGSEELTRKVLQESFDYYNALFNQEPAMLTGVNEISGYIFSNISQSHTQCPLIEGIVPIYRKVRPDELGEWKYGTFHSSIITEGRRFLPWCEKRIEENGGTIIQTRISALSDLTKNNFDVIFNCTGLGGLTIFGDRKAVPLRGQTIRVKAPWVKHFYYSDHDTYIIPGMDNVVLGGTRNYANYDLSPSRHDTASIWERCTNLLPRIATSEIERVWVGLRPHRDPVRIEAETLVINGKSIKIIHNYGHGGYGLTSAPGSANRAVAVFAESHRGNSKL